MPLRGALMSVAIAVLLLACVEMAQQSVGPGQLPPDASKSIATVPSAVVGASTRISVQVNDELGRPVSSGTETVDIRVRGVNGSPGGTALTVAHHGDGVYSALQTPTAIGQDTVSVTLNGAPVNGSPFLRDVVVIDTDEPFFDASNSGHVSHVFEDWSTQTSVAAIGTTDRIDGGAAWDVSDPGALSLQGPDPFGSVRSVRTSYPGSGQTARSIRTPAGPTNARNLEAGLLAGAVVLEWAARYSGTTAYIGKTMDWNNGSRGRFNYDPIAGSFGSRNNAECASDPLCALYYQNGTPRFPGLLPSNGEWSPNVFVINEDIPTVDGRFTNTMQYKQNAGWPAFQWGDEGESVRDNQWRRYKLRYTRSLPGYPLGHGRLEMWVRQPDGTTVKIMNYIGDPGGREEGLVFIGDIIRPQLDGINIRVYEISAHINPGGAVVDIGYIHVWSHPRQP